MTGKIKFFDDVRGYGFIAGDDGQEIFVHRTAFAERHDRSATLSSGDSVEYNIVPGLKGSQAADVRKIVREA